MSFQDLEAGKGRSWKINGSRQDSTQAVVSGIFQINTGVLTFHRLVNTLGTPKDTPELRQKLHKTQLNIEQLVRDTKAKLKEVSESDHRSGVNPSKKIADAKLVKDFQAVFKEFQKAKQTAAERETAYTPFVPQSAHPSSYTASEVDKIPEQRAQVMESDRQEPVLLDNVALIEERGQEMQKLYNQFIGLKELVKHCKVLVSNQGVMIDDIDTHIFNSRAATSQGKSQLAQAAKTQRSNSSLTCLLLVIFGIVILIVIIVLAA